MLKHNSLGQDHKRQWENRELYQTYDTDIPKKKQPSTSEYYRCASLENDNFLALRNLGLHRMIISD